jgi:hypothetical protein
MLGLAMLEYHDSHGKLPPAVVYGKDGKALYSWRVLVLPYIEEQGLYNEFRLDEAWDSPHNIRLLERRPHAYAPPSRYAHKIPPTHTYVHVFVGKGTPFENPEGHSMASITDGTSYTFLVIEAGKPVPWTKPEDLSYSADQPLPDLDGPFRDIMRVGFADGSHRTIPRDFDENAFRAAITRNGGEKFNLNSLDCPGK